MAPIDRFEILRGESDAVMILLIIGDARAKYDYASTTINYGGSTLICVSRAVSTLILY
jgi:hypothetical protein